ncbi:unnamed protein product [Orchesella dallaii]|uniref:UBR-type domain-containing protein n=1 Tax=Orchesella dallaii TaxID=48710 RepID=A0ABP1QU30_9HEXA
MDDAEDEITLQEALETQEMLEERAVAVLGASDPQNCSYSKGYMKRQALYACLTCNPKGAPFAQAAGVCLACSYKCHEGHELVELFTKRNFRCDCGNKRFPDNSCQLQPEKDDMNADNVYNQNFNGLYCSCHRPYPDPDQENDTADDSMIQCIICEDWFHFKHCLAYLNLEFESLEEDFEVICGPCMSRLNFLEHYVHLTLKPPVAEAVKNLETEDPAQQEKVENEASAITTTEPVTASVTVESNEPVVSAAVDVSANADPVNTATAGTKDHIVDSASQDSGLGSMSSTDNSCESIPACKLQTFAKGTLPFSDLQAVAWKKNLRASLCRCTNCVATYGQLKIGYLLDAEDTFEHYEAVGKKRSEDEQQSAEASISNQVNQMGRVEQLELIHGYNQFKEQLAEFLNGIAKDGKVVKKEDVNQFFAKMNGELAAKRRRLE